MLVLTLLPLMIVTSYAKSTSLPAKTSSFYVIPLGTSGGLEENNLSAYLLTTVTDGQPNSAYVSLDSGTIRHGLQ